MIWITFAWYSDDKLDVYHVCMDCEHTSKIYRSHLVMDTEVRARRRLREANSDKGSGYKPMCADCLFCVSSTGCPHRVRLRVQNV